MALLTAAGQASDAISTANARSVVPPGLVTAMRRAAASSGLAASSAPEPDTVCRASSRARSGGMPCSHRRLLHQFGQQEDIGRPAAGHRRDRIEQRLILDPGHHADRLQQPLAQHALRRLTPRPGQATVTPWRTAAGVFGIARTIAASSPSSARMPRDGAAGHDRQEHRLASELPVLRQRLGGVLRLHREHHGGGRELLPGSRRASGTTVRSGPAHSAAAGAGSTATDARQPLLAPAGQHRAAHAPAADQQDGGQFMREPALT